MNQDSEQFDTDPGEQAQGGYRGGYQPQEGNQQIVESEPEQGESHHQAYNSRHRLGSTSLKMRPNTSSALSYVGWWITGLFFLFAERRNRFVRFHAIQSLLTFVVISLIWVFLKYVFALQCLA